MTYLIIGVTVIVSWLAFNRQQMVFNGVFWPFRVKREGEWHRFISSGFLHANLMHLAFNMLVLWSFGAFVEPAFVELFGNMGRGLYVAMYLISIPLAEIASYIKHQDNPEYRSLGASGAVAAVVFAAILLQPMNNLYIFGLIPMPGIVFGVLYLLYSAYMAKRGTDNIGHSAHFWGSAVGFIFPILFRPSLLPAFFQQIQQALPI